MKTVLDILHKAGGWQVEPISEDSYNPPSHGRSSSNRWMRAAPLGFPAISVCSLLARQFQVDAYASSRRCSFEIETLPSKLP